jgi:hypothetical protein
VVVAALFILLSVWECKGNQRVLYLQIIRAFFFILSLATCFRVFLFLFGSAKVISVFYISKLFVHFFYFISRHLLSCVPLSVWECKGNQRVLYLQILFQFYL